ncbi:MAG: 3-deoxy-D-manno-octulosonic acid transferase [Bacteroidales bacterium]|jgi:3-deoxy-D-manno-octulosonic-acid transferase|nr:3-deoxy-D-manno-octulosonic acid transferase [Bacteroidales bacterium]
MNSVYNLIIRLFSVGLAMAAMFNEKAKLLYAGQKRVFSELSEVRGDRPLLWVHCASLGEFEQGRPLIERMRRSRPEFYILLTFFSPSGYEVRKNYGGADCICYLPLDSRANVRRFLKMTNPALIFFIKYEYWRNFFMEIRRQNIPLYMVSAIFRPEQYFFRNGSVGRWYRTILQNVTHFFVQNEASAALLRQIGLHNSTVTGDTRFDRVVEIAASRKDLPLIEQFKGNATLLVVGSSWPPDEELIMAAIARYPAIKFVIAPHEVKSANIERLLSAIPLATRYTNPVNLADSRVLIIDCIGILSSIYRYADIAYIGGGFGIGIHNTLEAAVYNIPLLFGPNYLRFQEAVELEQRGIAFPIEDEETLLARLSPLVDNRELIAEISNKCAEFMSENIGATDKVINFVFAENHLEGQNDRS